MTFFFFSSRGRHTRCALVTGVQTCALPILIGVEGVGLASARAALIGHVTVGDEGLPNVATEHGDHPDLGGPVEAGVTQGSQARVHPGKGVAAADRKSVVEGKSVSVRVDLGGRRMIKKKKQHRTMKR